MAGTVRSLALLLLPVLAACAKSGPPPTPAPTGDAAASSERPTAAAGAGTTDNVVGCTKVWTDAGAVFRSRSMYEEIAFDRGRRAIIENVHTWSAPKTANLSDAELAELDAAFGALCLSAVTNEPPPPPGGPVDLTIESKGKATVRLGVRGTTGGSFFVLTREQHAKLLDTLKKMSPEHRDCLPLERGGAVITGKLLSNRRANNPSASYPLVLLDSVVCVGGDPVVTAGSIELVSADLSPLYGKHVAATGTLSTQKKGENTEVRMVVTNVAER